MKGKANLHKYSHFVSSLVGVLATVLPYLLFNIFFFSPLNKLSLTGNTQ